MSEVAKAPSAAFWLQGLGLLVGAFAIGCTEFLIVGLLADIAQDLNAANDRSGLLVSGYAFGVVAAAPLSAVLVAGRGLKRMLFAFLILFVAGNVFCALAGSFEALLIARIVTAVSHPGYFGVAAVIIGVIAPPRRRSQMVALLFTCITAANVIGVPAGTAIGQALGWRSAFVFVAGLGGAALALNILFLPNAVGRDATARTFSEICSIINNPAVKGLLVSVISSICVFSVFTYLAFILTLVTNAPGGAIPVYLLISGVGSTIGGLASGFISKGNLKTAILGLLIAQLAILVVFYFSASQPIWTGLVILAWGAVSFAAVPVCQLLVMKMAGPLESVASIMNQGAFNIGIGVGAALGGLWLDLTGSYATLPLLGAFLAALALPAARLLLKDA